MLQKYPRTQHLPWSEGMTDDDKMIRDLSAFIGRRVIVTEKMDGENTTMYRDHIHARSLDSRHHPSRDWVKGFWSTVRYSIPDGYRVCGENLFARHSIAYDALPSYFMGFSVWDDRNFCMSWDMTTQWFERLGVTPVPVLYDGHWDEETIRRLYDADRDRDLREGYVVRVADAFPAASFGSHVAKFVRSGHVQTNEHWMHAEIVRNGLR